MERTPINRKEIQKALIQKFGGVETARYYLNNALSDLQTMEVGVGENNPLLAAKTLESIRENLENLKMLLDEKGNKPGIEKEIKSLS